MGPAASLFAKTGAGGAVAGAAVTNELLAARAVFRAAAEQASTTTTTTVIEGSASSSISSISAGKAAVASLTPELLAARRCYSDWLNAGDTVKIPVPSQCMSRLSSSSLSSSSSMTPANVLRRLCAQLASLGEQLGARLHAVAQFVLKNPTAVLAGSVSMLAVGAVTYVCVKKYVVDRATADADADAAGQVGIVGIDQDVAFVGDSTVPVVAAVAERDTIPSAAATSAGDAAAAPRASQKPAVAVAAASASAPDALCCAISGELYDDPVTTPSGHSYSRRWITEYLRSRGGRAGCPLNPAVEIAESDLRTNFGLRSVVEAFAAQQL